MLIRLQIHKIEIPIRPPFFPFVPYFDPSSVEHSVGVVEVLRSSPLSTTIVESKIGGGRLGGARV